MAEGSQHTLQIMETQTRFYLNTAIDNWRTELAGHPDLTPDVRRELEAHLRDTVIELQRSGLNDEESFWLARRRIGQPRRLCEEFVKADPARAWRERVFWMALALLVVNLWQMLLSAFPMTARSFAVSRFEDILPEWVLFYLPNWLRQLPDYPLPLLFRQFVFLMPILCFAVFLASGRLKCRSFFWDCVFKTRKHFVVMGLAIISVLECLILLLVNFLGTNRGHPSLSGFFFSNLLWAFPLIGLIAWLTPTQNRTKALGLNLNIQQ